MSVLSIRDVSVSRGSGGRRVAVLDHACLSVDAGDVVLLLGPNGSGKTTLLATAAGLISPVAGSCELAGTVIDHLSHRERRECRAKNIGFVFQRANLLSQLTIRENVALGAALAGRSLATARRAADAILAEIEIADLGDRYPHEVSMGQEQRAAGARALVHDPVLVLADEPTASLDSQSALTVMKALVDAVRRRGAAAVIASHDPTIAAFATRVVHLRAGAVVETLNGDGPAMRVATPERNSEAKTAGRA
jgi:putative ABC transport system ATP-binding protein